MQADSTDPHPQTLTTDVVLYSEAEAREAIKAVRTALENSLSSLDRAMRLGEQFKEREGYTVLGYPTLAACFAFELQVSRSRAYQLIDQMKASALLEQETGQRPQASPSARAARDIIRAAGVQQLDATDQLNELHHEEPITRSSFGGGEPRASSEYDSGEAIYRCRHCQKTGTLAQLTRCLETVREQTEEF